jgi:hypothetical protein
MNDILPLSHATGTGPGGFSRFKKLKLVVVFDLPSFVETSGGKLLWLCGSALRLVIDWLEFS